jgi:hypothetical protein
MSCIIGIGFKKAKNQHLAPQNVAAEQKSRTIPDEKESS